VGQKHQFQSLSNLGTNVTTQKSFVPFFSSKQKKEDSEPSKKRFENLVWK
jgi:hypothetical protein